jgi:glucan phosphoethanolaminetransferase (alkaline phosphatase superfamily)
MRGFMRISDSFGKIKAFYLFLPFMLFIFSIPKFRKSWKISLIISLIAIPVIDFHAFSVWLYNIPDDFYHPNSTFNEAQHMGVFARRFSLCLGVFIAFLILILILEKPLKN